MRVIRLKGHLGKKYGKVHKFDVRSPAEAVRALCANFPGIEQEFATSYKRGVAYKCVVDNDRLPEEHLGYPMSRRFTITPVVHGGGKTLGIILGVVLIGAALVFSGGLAGVPLLGASGALAGSVGIGLGITWGTVALFGVALVLGGIAQMLAPTPSNSGAAQNVPNNYFDGAVNVSAQGACVPFGYGRAIVGSAVISANITIEQQGSSGATEDLAIRGMTRGVNLS